MARHVSLGEPVQVLFRRCKEGRHQQGAPPASTISQVRNSGETARMSKRVVRMPSSRRGTGEHPSTRRLVTHPTKPVIAENLRWHSGVSRACVDVGSDAYAVDWRGNRSKNHHVLLVWFDPLGLRRVLQKQRQARHRNSRCSWLWTLLGITQHHASLGFTFVLFQQCMYDHSWGRWAKLLTSSRDFQSLAASCNHDTHGGWAAVLTFRRCRPSDPGGEHSEKFGKAAAQCPAKQIRLPGPLATQASAPSDTTHMSAVAQQHRAALQRIRR